MGHRQAYAGAARARRLEALMNHLIVIGFDHFDDARAALRTLRSLERVGHLMLEDTAVVERDPDGTTHVRNEVSGTTEAAVVVGALIGGVLMFAFPPAGWVVGAAVGALVGIAFGTGAPRAFVDEVSRTLRPGRSALFLVTRQTDADAVLAALRPYRGEVIQSTLDSETEEALRSALKP
jgi:uncharacterized membrane protein